MRKKTVSVGKPLAMALHPPSLSQTPHLLHLGHKGGYILTASTSASPNDAWDPGHVSVGKPLAMALHPPSMSQTPHLLHLGHKGGYVLTTSASTDPANAKTWCLCAPGHAFAPAKLEPEHMLEASASKGPIFRPQGPAQI